MENYFITWHGSWKTMRMNIYNREDIEALLYECFNQLSELAVSHGFKGNLCHNTDWRLP